MGVYWFKVPCETFTYKNHEIYILRYLKIHVLRCSRLCAD